MRGSFQGWCRVSYGDKGHEAELPFQLALARGEAAPLILVRLECGSVCYRLYDSELGRPVPRPWFISVLPRLELVADFGRITYNCRTTSRWLLYRVPDLATCQVLWAMSSTDAAIAHMMFAADLDMSLLAQLLGQAWYVDLDTEAQRLASWVYDIRYGGGADEHHGLFYSRDPALAHALRQQAGAAVFG